jgi:lysophospholipase L1-like esterase
MEPALPNVCAMRITPNDIRLRIRGAIRAVISGTRLRVDRPIADEGGLGADAPGVFLELVTDAAALTVHLQRNGRHLRQDAINSNLVLTGEGKVLASGKIPDGVTAEYDWAVTLPHVSAPRPLRFHFPYGDAVDLLGLTLPPGTRILAPHHDMPGIRWLACGDSITQGFHATSALTNYPTLVGAERGWETCNAGIGGRCVEAADGAALAGIPVDIVTVLLGFNDYYHQRSPADCQRNYTTILRALRSGGAPRRPIVVITPLWSSHVMASGQSHRLAEYRRAITAAAQSIADPALEIIAGESLIPPQSEFFTDGIHPNDAGFKILANNLARLLPDPPHSH